MKVGITGSSGFIGYHLTNYLFLKKEIELIHFDKAAFSDATRLQELLLKCEAIVHLAGVNRGSDEDVYNCNIWLATQLIEALERCHATPHIIFASSIQEDKKTPYGRSKKQATDRFINWANRSGAKFTSLLIPNVFGPFCKPFYNSVIATFCYQLSHEQEPKIEIDATLKLIFINDLVECIYSYLNASSTQFRVYPPANIEINVSDILARLTYFKDVYLKNHMMPVLHSTFDVNLFNTFRSYIDANYFPIQSVLHRDDRGNLAEVVKEFTGGQVFYSLTKPGKTRGNHYHRRKIERFFVINGLASLKLRKIGSNQVIEYLLNGDNPSYVDIPLYYAHSITNIGKTDLITIFWTNEIFKNEDADTYYEIV